MLRFFDFQVNLSTDQGGSRANPGNRSYCTDDTGYPEVTPQNRLSPRCPEVLVLYLKRPYTASLLLASSSLGGRFRYSTKTYQDLWSPTSGIKLAKNVQEMAVRAR
jgi:hypothetical protein